MVREVRAEQGAHVSALAFLDTITCTKPFTVADARELHAMIHAALTPWPDTVVDVYTTSGDIVYVRIDTFRGTIERRINVV